ncbi:MAG: glycosyltransferase [Planctomycetes bacterium]|nr:glycosyltransferase [Planctomycetota bacterium]
MIPPTPGSAEATAADASGAPGVPPSPAGVQVIRVPAEGGGDPLVRRYLEAHRATCAWTTVSWLWIVIGAIVAMLGGAIGSHLAGDAAVLPEDATAMAHWMNAHFGNAGSCLIGMAIAAVVASTAGALVKPRGVPAGLEPYFGFAAVALVYLLLYDLLVCLGVVTGVICLIYFLAITFRVLAIAVGGHQGARTDALVPPASGWPLYTVLVPLYKERNVAKKILHNLAQLDYPADRLDVKLLLEADDAETYDAVMAAGVPAWAEVVVVPHAQPKTKPRACNHGLERARGDFLVIFDAEDRPEPDQLKQAVCAFALADPRVACLQAQLAYHNHRQNLLTRWFALEYNVWFRRYLGGLVRLGVPIPLGGTSNHFRTSVLRELGGWDPFNVTEDCDLGVRLYMARHRTMTLDSTTWEEANSHLGNWIRQRSRWLKGYLITHLVWSRRPIHLVARLGPWAALGFFLSVFCVSSLAAFNLILWCVAGVHATLIGLDLANGYGLWEVLTTHDREKLRYSWQMMYSGRNEDPVLSTMSQVFFAAAICLFVGNLLFVLIAALAGRRPGQRGMWWAALASPIYWVLISIGAWKAVWQLLFKPHYWEKTVHGLDEGPATKP